MRNEFDRRNRNLRAPHMSGVRGVQHVNNDRSDTRARLMEQHGHALNMLHRSGYKEDSPLHMVAASTLKEVTRLHIDEGLRYDHAFEQVRNTMFIEQYDKFGENLHDLMSALEKANNRAFRIMRAEHEKRHNRRRRTA